MKCNNCGAQNPADGKFCVECGGKLLLGCPKCGALVTEGLKFCEGCGERLIKAPVQPKPQTSTVSAPKPVSEVIPPAQPVPTEPPPPRLSTATVNERKGNNGILIGVGAVVVIAIAGFFVFKSSEKSVSPALIASTVPTVPATSVAVAKTSPVAPTTTAIPTTEQAVSDSSANVSTAPTKPEVLALIPLELAKPSIAAMLDAIYAKDDKKIDSNLESIKQLPLPNRGARKPARAANDLGLAALQSGDFSEAVKQFNEAIKSDSSDQEIVNNLAYGLYKANRMDEASQASMAALTLNPTRTSAWINLAMISAAQGKQKTAVSAYLLGYKYSQNPQKTEEFLAKQIQEDNEAIRLGASKALEIIEAGR